MATLDSSGRGTSPAADEILPRKFDRYELLRKLATGGMAEIYLAKQSGLEGFEKVVVLKRILSHLAQDEEFVAMFRDEARIAAKLSHPNIVQIYDLGIADDTYYIAMEYVSGRNVQHLIAKHQARGETIPVEHVCRIVAGVCDGLHYAHSRKDFDGSPLNIVHRDISPQNILVSFAGGVKVVDFGIAKASTQIAQTRAGVLKGKYAYMSPEQVRGTRVDHRSDIFALGLVMYEMLTGTRAFERDTSLKTLKAIVQEKPLNPRELNPAVPMEVVKLLSKALEKNADRRYKTAQEMYLAIEEWLENSPKKSNNVRLSRYLYDLFDDELNAADGTIVVKGVGEVIVPAVAEPAPPEAADEIDQGTLTAALAPGPSEKPLGQPTAGEATAASVTDESEDDGKTIPALDLATFAPVAARGAAPAGADAALSPKGISAVARAIADDGVSSPRHSVASPLAPRAAHAPAPASARGDVAAAALLAKVDAIAGDSVATQTGASDAPRDPVEPAAVSRQRPAVRGGEQTSKSASARGRPAQPVRAAAGARLTPAWTAILAASAALVVLSIAAGVWVVYVGRGRAGAPDELVSLSVSSDPTGAQVLVDNLADDLAVTPTEVLVPRGKTVAVELRLAGHAPVRTDVAVPLSGETPPVSLAIAGGGGP